METPKPEDKYNIINILTQAFAENKNANFVVKQDGKWFQRLTNLFEYSYQIASPDKGIFLNNARKAAAICQLPGKKVPLIKQTLLDLKLAFNTIGIHRIPMVLQREAYIKKCHPGYPYLYIWFLGVHPLDQGKGYGSALLEEILAYAKNYHWPVYLETSTRSNLPFYEKNGFKVYHEWHFKHAGFPLWFLRKEDT